MGKPSGVVPLETVWQLLVSLHARVPGSPAMEKGRPTTAQNLNICSDFTCKSPKLEQPRCPSVGEWLDTPHQGPSIPWSSTQPQRRMSHWDPEQPGWSPRNCAKWKGLIPVDYTWCDSVPKTLLKWQMCGDWQQVGDGSGPGRELAVVGAWGTGVLVAAVMGRLCLHVLMSEPWS